MSSMEVHAVANRVRSEFIEMPGLRLTPRQAARLWGLDAPACENVIDVLVSRLRGKIDRDFDRKLIHTMRGFGYVLKLQ